MKNIVKFAAASAFAAAVAVPAFAFAAGYGTAGCGLGSIVIGDKPGIIQIFAATTNGTFGSQTLGITTGTSNCAEGGMRKAELQRDFVAVNLDNLNHEAAAGNGEYLSAFSTVLGCESGSKTEFNATTQLHHDEIFTPGANADTVLSNWKNVLAKNEKLGASCKL